MFSPFLHKLARKNIIAFDRKPWQFHPEKPDGDFGRAFPYKGWTFFGRRKKQPKQQIGNLRCSEIGISMLYKLFGIKMGLKIVQGAFLRNHNLKKFRRDSS
jgi:hypothetical protein